MEITKTLYVKDRDEWREWLRKHHAIESEIWLVFPRKASGEQAIPYSDAVEEALCYGWIDSIVKKIDATHGAQRFTPRRRGSNWSALNKERVRKLIKAGKMAEAGLAALGDALEEEFSVPDDILEAVKADKEAWKHFQALPESYVRIRVGFIEGARNRPEEFKKRLANFVRMTAQNKLFGTIP